MAATSHQLGWVAQQQGNLEKAEDWYLQALHIHKDFDNRPGMASSFEHLGMLAEARGPLKNALEWIVRCVTTFTGFPTL